MWVISLLIIYLTSLSIWKCSPKTDHGCPWGKSKNGRARKNPLPWGCLQEWIACERNKQTNAYASLYKDPLPSRGSIPLGVGIDIASLIVECVRFSSFCHWKSHFLTFMAGALLKPRETTLYSPFGWALSSTNNNCPPGIYLSGGPGVKP